MGGNQTILTEPGMNGFDEFLCGPSPSLTYRDGSYLASWEPVIACQLEHQRSIANPQKKLQMNANPASLHRLLTLDCFTTSRNCLCGYNSTVNSETCKLCAIEMAGTAREMGGKTREMGVTLRIRNVLGLNPGLEGDWCK